MRISRVKGADANRRHGDDDSEAPSWSSRRRTSPRTKPHWTARFPCPIAHRTAPMGSRSARPARTSRCDADICMNSLGVGASATSIELWLGEMKDLGCVLGNLRGKARLQQREQTRTTGRRESVGETVGHDVMDVDAPAEQRRIAHTTPACEQHGQRHVTGRERAARDREDLRRRLSAPRRETPRSVRRHRAPIDRGGPARAQSQSGTGVQRRAMSHTTPIESSAASAFSTAFDEPWFEPTAGIQHRHASQTRHRCQKRRDRMIAVNHHRRRGHCLRGDAQLARVEQLLEPRVR